MRVHALHNTWRSVISIIVFIKNRQPVVSAFFPLDEVNPWLRTMFNVHYRAVLGDESTCNVSSPKLRRASTAQLSPPADQMFGPRRTHFLPRLTTRSPSPDDHDTATFAHELDRLRRVYRRFRHYYERMNRAFSYQLAANYVFACIVAMTSCYSAINVTFNSGKLAIALSYFFSDRYWL
jgi:hypothetical protein